MHHLQKALLALAVAGSAGAAEAASPPPPPPPPPPAHHHHHERRRPEDFRLNVEAQAQAGAQAGAGGGSWSMEEGSPTIIGALDVDTGERSEVRKVAYEAKRKITEKVVIQAVCIDDRTVPHPASQVHAERDVDEAYEGELYRCIAGTRLQATIAKWNGEVRFDNGRIIDCSKNQALYKGPHGDVGCREQIPQRDCNERSLLRRYGAGVKVLVITREETYTAYREETVTTREQSKSSSLILDGGVGGVVR
jgi:hypothetical protein